MTYMANVEERISKKMPIKLMNSFDLRIPKEVIKTCSEIDWKLKEAVKN